MNFEELLDPYKDGGTASSYTRRTLGVILDWLVNKKQYPLDIVGAAVFQVFFWLSAGNEFKGDGSFGSKGRELDTAIRLKCDEFMQLRLTDKANAIFIEVYAEELLNGLVKQEKTISNLIKELDKKIDNNAEATVGITGILIEKINNYPSFKRGFLRWWYGRDVVT